MSFRITPHDDGDVVAIARSVCTGKFGGGYLLVREYSKDGVEHYHGLVSVVTAKSFHNAFSRAFASKKLGGNKHWQCKNCTNDIQNAQQYVCKGSSEHPNPKGEFPDVVEMSGLYFTESKVKEWHEKYWEHSKKVKSSKNLKFPTQVEHFMKMNDRPMTKKGVIGAVVDYSIEQEKPFNDFYMLGVAKFILCKNDKNAKQAYKRSLLNRWNQDGEQGDYDGDESFGPSHSSSAEPGVSYQIEEDDLDAIQEGI